VINASTLPKRIQSIAVFSNEREGQVYVQRGGAIALGVGLIVLFVGAIYGAIVFALVAGGIVFGAMFETFDAIVDDVLFGYEQEWEDDGSDLFHAVINDDTEEVRQLLATNEFDVNETDYVGDSLLYNAVSNINYELAEVLLEEGADLMIILMMRAHLSGHFTMPIMKLRSFYWNMMQIRRTRIALATVRLR
uniref:ankyrin repeat domain-containing protein n=1 Tax=Bacillus sp. JCM 19041 TaxID=1460637 RepID=UPI000A927EAE